MTPIELWAFYVALVSPLWAPFLWWEIQGELHRRACDRAWDALCERDRCDALQLRRDGAE